MNVRKVNFLNEADSPPRVNLSADMSSQLKERCEEEQLNSRASFQPPFLTEYSSHLTPQWYLIEVKLNVGARLGAVMHETYAMLQNHLLPRTKEIVLLFLFGFLVFLFLI